MTQPKNLEPPGEPATIAYPIGSLVHLAELLGEIDQFFHSGTDVIDLLTAFMTRHGHNHPDFRACNLIDDLCFTAHRIRRLTDDLPAQQT
jgi:hypothetical protein